MSFTAFTLKSNTGKLREIISDAGISLPFVPSATTANTPITKIKALWAKGEPTKIETQLLKTKTKETWIYGNKSSGDYFVFEENVAVKVVDR